MISVKTLASITSEVSKLSDQNFIQTVFSELQINQEQCIILPDEVYVKHSLLYMGLTYSEKPTTMQMSLQIKCSQLW